MQQKTVEMVLKYTDKSEQRITALGAITFFFFGVTTWWSREQGHIRAPIFPTPLHPFELSLRGAGTLTGLFNNLRITFFWLKENM